MDNHVAIIQNDPAGSAVSFNCGVIAMQDFDIFFNNSWETIQKPFTAGSCDNEAVGVVRKSF